MEIAVCLALMVLTLAYAGLKLRGIVRSVDKQSEKVLVSREFYEASLDVHYSLCRAGSKSEKNKKLPLAIHRLDKAINDAEVVSIGVAAEGRASAN